MIVTPDIRTLIVIGGAFVVFLLAVIGLGMLVFRQLKTMQNQIVLLQATQTTLSHAQEEMKDRQSSLPSLLVEVKTLQTSSQELMKDWRKDTEQLGRALRTSYQQGTWGERELRQIVLLAGMMEHCDFDVKPPLPGGKIPDLVIHMPHGRSIAVDAKAPTQVYVDAMKCEDEKTQKVKLEAYAHRVKQIMQELAKKEYWKGLQPSPDLVILFLPNEAMFRAALEYDFTLLDTAVQKNILLASPMSLIALLKVIEYGWSQEQRAQNVQHVVDRSKDLQKELEMWLGQWQQLRNALNTTVTEFNRVTASYEDTILPLVKELGSFDGKLTNKEKIFEIKPIRISLKGFVEEVPLQKEFTAQLERWRTIILPYLPGQKKRDSL